MLPSSSKFVIIKPRVKRSDLICRVRRSGGVPPPDLYAQDSCACPLGPPVVRETVVVSMLQTASSLRVPLARQLLLLAPRLDLFKIPFRDRVPVGPGLALKNTGYNRCRAISSPIAQHLPQCSPLSLRTGTHPGPDHGSFHRPPRARRWGSIWHPPRAVLVPQTMASRPMLEGAFNHGFVIHVLQIHRVGYFVNVIEGHL